MPALRAKITMGSTPRMPRTLPSRESSPSTQALVLAAGVARGKKFSGEAEYLGRGVSYCATCDGMFDRSK